MPLGNFDPPPPLPPLGVLYYDELTFMDPIGGYWKIYPNKLGDLSSGGTQRRDDLVIVLRDPDGFSWRVGVTQDGGINTSSTSLPATEIPVFADENRRTWRLSVDSSGALKTVIETREISTHIIRSPNGINWRLQLASSGDLSTFMTPDLTDVGSILLLTPSTNGYLLKVNDYGNLYTEETNFTSNFITFAKAVNDSVWIIIADYTGAIHTVDVS